MLEPTTPTWGSCFAFARNKLDEADARALCEEAFSVDFGGLIAGADATVTNAQFKRLRDFVRRRSEGEPVAYIVRSKGFWRHEFAVSSDTLIPRPETEAIVETVLPFLSSVSSVLDLGTGSGAIGLSIAAETGANVLLTDLSCTALQVAAENAATLDINVQFRQSNWYDAIDESFDCIVSNPPYVASHDKHLQTGDLPYEPHLALDGGLDGLEALRTVVGEAPDHLRPGGRLLVEHGFDQADAVGTLFRAAGFRRIGLVRDLSNHPRVTHGLLP